MQPAQIEQKGLVVAYYGSTIAVESETGQVFQCHLRRNQTLPVVGDWVNWQLEPSGTGIVLNILPRRSLLARGDKSGAMRPIAANLDIMFIVMAPPPIFSEYLVDRYLVAAEILQLSPIIIINKIDLLDEATLAATIKRSQIYQNIPYPVILSSIYTEQGLLEMKQQLQGKTGVLVGPSGVGKSSLITALSQQTDIAIGEVSSKGAGKHTTTATRLYHLPIKNSQLIDSPGVREFNLWPVSLQAILQGFKEFGSWVKQCKFKDCSHQVEPGCAIRLAVEQGKIHAGRYANYQMLVKETKQIENKDKRERKKS